MAWAPCLRADFSSIRFGIDIDVGSGWTYPVRARQQFWHVPNHNPSFGIYHCEGGRMTTKADIWKFCPVSFLLSFDAFGIIFLYIPRDSH
jgi:hypothetical protein